MEEITEWTQLEDSLELNIKRKAGFQTEWAWNTSSPDCERHWDPTANFSDSDVPAEGPAIPQRQVLQGFDPESWSHSFPCGYEDTMLPWCEKCKQKQCFPNQMASTGNSRESASEGLVKETFVPCEDLLEQNQLIPSFDSALRTHQRRKQMCHSSMSASALRASLKHPVPWTKSNISFLPTRTFCTRSRWGLKQCLCVAYEFCVQELLIEICQIPINPTSSQLWQSRIMIL